VPIAVGDQGREQLDLPLGLHHRLVRAVQVVEVRDQRLDPRRDIEGLEHVVAHEIGQIADRFHGHRLVEELERLIAREIAADAEATPEPRAVPGKAVLDFGAGAAQAFPEAGDVRAELREVRGDREVALGADEEARRLALRVFRPEHLRERDGLVVAGVVEHA